MKLTFGFILYFIGWNLLYSPLSFSQTSPSANASQVQLDFQKLNVLGSVLYIAAHPDDENTRLLAYLANEKHYRTGYLSLTRGDGGQNLIGDEQGEQLGLIRTQELLAARRVDGAEQFFTRAYDFGYTKSPEETFQFWDKEKVLSDVVFVIRKFQPDIIICRFPTTGEGGHGQHTASAILAKEAFTAAADPNRFPEQLQYVKPWQAKRLLWNTFNFGNTNTTAADQFKVDVGVYNALLGKSYGEIAAESRSNHKSQGFGVPRNRGSQLEYFKTILGDAPVNDLMDGVNTTWSRLNGAEKIQSLVSAANKDYLAINPSASVPRLFELRIAIQRLNESYWKDQKLKETEKLILLCSGIWFEAYATEAFYSAGQTFDCKMQAIVRSNIPVIFKSVSAPGFDSTLNQTLPFNQMYTLQRKATIANDVPPSQPYWLLSPRSAGMFVSASQDKVGQAENDPPLSVRFVLAFDGTEITYYRPVVYKFTDPVKGEVYQPLVIAPPITATLPTNILGCSSNQAPPPLEIRLKAFVDHATGKVKLSAPARWNISPSHISFTMEKKGDEQTVTFSITPPAGFTDVIMDSLQVLVEMNGKIYSQSLRTISYDHIPSITYFPPANAKLFTVPFKTNVNNIGYIKGAGDKIPNFLSRVGFKVTMLDEYAVGNTSLQKYDAIITGVRAYNTDEWLKNAQGKLLSYVKNGGVLLVQYNTTDELVTDQLGPYPFKITRSRVADETAKVHFINADDPILNLPNKITDKDFDGWIQERGLYFVSDADSNYRKIITMNDKGEDPLDGSLIVADYGQGKYVYTSLSFFREIPAGVPGAARLFVNLISKNE
jgi:LmbE family N-acetylglucosaminyl deacetylase